jgi:L-iditol 2-dehydrogenase
MNMKNRVARLVKVGKIKIFEEELPALKENEVLVAIKSVGICGSDMHYFLEGGLGNFKQSLPMEIGHESSGVVIECFDKNEFKKGDRVAIEPGRPCFYCRWCLKGKHNLCENITFMGANSQGAFADYIIVHKSQLAKIPDNMSFSMGALLEPLGVGLHAVNLIKPKSTESAAIIGSGSIGLCLMSVLKRFGFNELYMVDKFSYRVRFAKKMGATKSFLFEDSISGIKKITKNTGVACVFDTGGTQDSISACVEIVGVSGTIGLIGIPTTDYIKYNPHKLRTKEVTLQNVRRSNQTLRDCVKLYSQNNDIEKIITHEFKFKDIQKAFNLVGKYGDKVIKCVITNNEH